MILIRFPSLATRVASCLLLPLSLWAQSAAGPNEPDDASLVRRVASTALLAAEEYALGFDGTRVVSAAEIDEAKLFLREAARAADGLPAEARLAVREAISAALRLVEQTVPPDSVSVAVEALVAELADRLGVSLEEVPVHAPSLERGAALYQTNCARCHGTLGRADGAAARGLLPPPSDLTAADALADASPLDFYRRVTIGIAGTAMPGFEHVLPEADRWAVALYASTLRLPAPDGPVPPALLAFATTARMSDRAILDAAGRGSGPGTVAAVRMAGFSGVTVEDDRRAAFAVVRAQVDSAEALARLGRAADAHQMAFDAYLSFERVEREVRVKNASLAAELETSFARLREQAAASAGVETIAGIRRQLLAGLERAERTVGDDLAPVNLFVQSFVLLVREGLEAILVIGALIAFLVKTGASARKRDIHIGVGGALAASVLTAFALETVFLLTPARQEVLEGLTMAAAAVMLFYVSYWLLSRIEVARWNQFVRSKVRDALTSGSALALAVVAFLAVYREGFETVLFYKALMLSAGPSGVAPVVLGFVAGAVVLAVVYLAINRFGVRLPLRPFFGVTSAFLYYMAFVFAGKAVAELQGGGLVSTTVVEWAPRIPVMGIYPTVESLAAQMTLVALAALALAWILWLEPARARARAMPASPEPTATESVTVGMDREILRSLDRIDADVSEIRSEVERLRDRVVATRS